MSDSFRRGWADEFLRSGGRIGGYIADAPLGSFETDDISSFLRFAGFATSILCEPSVEAPLYAFILRLSWALG